MKAYSLVKFSEPKEAFRLIDQPLRQPAAGEVGIRVTAFGINFADIMARQGLYRECPPLPCVIGYDVEGEIAEVGENVTGFQVGDRVFALTRFGGYAQHVTVPSIAVGHLPEDAPLGAGCGLAVHGITAYHGLLHAQTLLPGEKVLVHAAAGGLGITFIQIALWKKCEVIGVVGGHAKVELLKSLGVDHIVDHHKGDYVEYVHKYLGGKVDVILDNVGGASIKKGKSILAPGGRLVTLGAAALSGKRGKLNMIKLGLGFGFFSPISYLGKSQSLIGINMLRLADHRPDIIAEEFKGVEKLYHEGVLNPHIGKIFPHEQLPDAHAFVEGRKSIGKIIVKW
jgi:NADPH:quinone reductase-like Zn-dependent oxidoreductase